MLEITVYTGLPQNSYAHVVLTTHVESDIVATFVYLIMPMYSSLKSVLNPAHWTSLKISAWTFAN